MFSPYGWLHPTALDGGDAAEPFGPRSERRLTRLATDLDCVVIGGGEIIHTNDDALALAYGVDADELARMEPSGWFIEGLGPDLEPAVPVVWHAVGVPFDPSPDDAGRLGAALARRDYIAVRDELSRDRLQRAGVGRPIEVVPDSALLLSRVLPPDVLARRVEQLRATGSYPVDGGALVVQGNRELVEHAPQLAGVIGRWLDDHPEMRPVLIETGACRGDGDFADALEAELARPVQRLPAGSPVEDIAAAIAGAALFAGSSLHGSITALVYGRPYVVLNLAEESKLDGFALLTGGADVVARKPEEAEAALVTAMAREPDAALVRALQDRVDAHFDLIAAIAAAAATKDARVTKLQADLDEARAELARLRATKTFRYTEWLRRIYGRLRAR